jgi:hypothetical protein
MPMFFVILHALGLGRKRGNLDAAPRDSGETNILYTLDQTLE